MQSFEKGDDNGDEMSTFFYRVSKYYVNYTDIQGGLKNVQKKSNAATQYFHCIVQKCIMG